MNESQGLETDQRGYILPYHYSYVLTGDGVDNIIWRGTQKLGDDGELIDMILSREQWLALQHLGEDTTRTPDINLDIILLPCEHNLRRSVVSRGNVSGHLRILDSCKTEVADLQVTILIYENVAGFEITMNNTCRVDIF